MPTRVPMGNGDTFLVESDAGTGVVRAARGEDLIETSTETLEQSLTKVRSVATSIITSLGEMPSGPDRLRAEFGICIGAESGVVVLKGTANAHFVLELVWERGQKE